MKVDQGLISQELRPTRFSTGPQWRSPRDLDDPGMRRERVYRLRDARLVFADYRLLQYDFPWLRSEALMAGDPALRTLSNRARRARIRAYLDQWLLERGGIISEAQQNHREINEPIGVTGETTDAWRPTRYGRALVVPVRSPDGRGSGMLDLKGVGVAPGRVPAQQAHGTGLCLLGEALYDTLMQWVIDEIFRLACPGFFSVPVYGVIDTGFGKHGNYSGIASPQPTGIVVRRAHRRPRNAVELPATGSTEERVKLQVEMILRRYGITSCNDTTAIRIKREGGQVRITYGHGPVKYGPAGMRALRDFFIKAKAPPRLDGINVQLTRECGFMPSFAQVVDFGHYTVKSEFPHPVTSLVRDHMVFFGGALLPASPHFPRPDARLALPFEEWGEVDGKRSRMSSWIYSLANDFHGGRCQGETIFRDMRRVVSGVVAQWDRNR